MNLKIVSSVGLAVLTLSGIGGYEFIIKDKALSTEVVVAKERIDAHQELSKSNLIIERRKKDELVEGYLTPDDLSGLLGKDTNTVILANQMLSTNFVDYENLTPDPRKEEAIRPIPSDWIYAMPGSLRRKDTIFIYAVRDHKDTQKENREEVKVEEKAMTEQEATSTSPEEVANRFEPILEHVPVSYVKTSGNQEVMTEEDKEENQERLYASGSASDIEVNISEEQLKIIVDHIDAGYKLYISYR